jgi:hypothetical protein
MGIRGVLENGFWLKWKAANCNDCEKSGGFFGFGFVFDDDNINYCSQCFCADRAHYVGCKNCGQFSLEILIFLFLSLRKFSFSDSILVLSFFVVDSDGFSDAFGRFSLPIYISFGV